MNETLTMRTERADDIPLLLAQMQRMGLASLLDAYFPTHGNWEGLSLGKVTTIWLTHLHAPADHRMNRVQPWAERRLETLRGCSDPQLEVRDLGDDRLADILRHLSDDANWRAFEQTPEGVYQELYGLFLAHYAVRALMAQAAIEAHLNPDRLSFTDGLFQLTEMIDLALTLEPEEATAPLLKRLHHQMAQKVLPARCLRINRREVKRIYNKYKPKKRKETRKG